MAGLRSLVWKLIRLPARLALRRSLARRTFTPPAELALNYGGVLRSAGIVAGGAVKLLHLEQRWPEREDFNVLYLVSSVPPPHALDLACWAKSRGAKLVWNQNGVAFPAWAGDRCEETNQPMAELLRLADFVVYQSEFCKVSADRFLGAAPCPSEVLFNPVDLDVFTPAAPPPPLDCWRLLTAGTHHDAGRVLGPLETLRRLLDAGHRAQLTVAGALRWRGAREQVAATISRLGLGAAVKLLPAFTRAEAPAVYRAAHILLHPKYHDPCPTVVIEALACGLPVVGSRSGGMPELVGDDLIAVPLSWETAPSLDPEPMAASVVRIMASWPERSREARERAARLFGATAWVARHREIFERTLGAPCP